MPKQASNHTQKRRTELQNTEEPFQEKEEIFRVFFEQAAVGVAQIETATRRFVRINKKYCDIVGYSVDELRKLSFKKISHPDDIDKDLQNMKLLVSGQIREFSMEKRYFHKNGSTVWVNLTVSPMWQEGEKPSYHIAVVEDITPRKRAEEKLQKAYNNLERQVLLRTDELRKSNQRLKREVKERKKTADALRLSETRYRTLFEGAGAGIAYYDTKGKLLLLNSRAASNLGGRSSDFVGKTLWQFLDDDLAKLVFSRIKDVVKNGAHHEYEDTLDLAGRTISFLSNFHTIKDENSKVIGVQVISQDITQRKQAEAELEKQRQLVQRILDTNPNVMYIFDIIERRNVFINQEVSTAVGLTIEEFAKLGDNVLPQLIHPDDFPRLTDHFEKLAGTNDADVISFEYRMKHKSGEWRWFLSQDRIFERTPAGKVELIIGAAQDITDLKKVEEALRESETKFRTLAESTSAGIFIFQEDLMSYVNPAAAKITGYTEQQLLQMKFWEVIHPEFGQMVHKRGKARQKGTVVPPKYGVKIITRAGDERWIDFTGCTITYQNKPAVLGTAIDITEQKQAERDLRARARQQQVAAKLGTMALSGMTLDELFNEIVVSLAKTLEVEFSKILELQPNGERLLLRAGTGWKRRLVGRATVGAGKKSQAGFTLLQTKAVVVEDLSCDKRFNGPPLLKQHKVVSGMSVVIAGKDRPFGVLGVHTGRKRQFSEQDVHFLEAVANLLAEVIERDQAETALHLSEERYRVLFDNAGAGIAYYDLDGKLLLLNSKAAENLGGRPSDYVKKPLWQFLEKEIADDIYSRIQEISKTNEPQEYEDTYLLNGRTLSFFSNFHPVCDLISGRINGVQIISQDISERKETEEALRNSQQQLQLIIDNVPGLIAYIDPKERYRFVNLAYAEWFGLKRSDIIGKTLKEIMRKSVYEAFRDRIKAALSGETISFEDWFSSSEGERRFLNGIYAPHESDGEVQGFFALLMDVTQRKQADEKISFQAKLLDAVGQAVIATDLEGTVIYWNREAEKLYGWPKSEALGQNILSLTPSKQMKERAAAIMADLRKGKSWSGEFWVRKRDGFEFPAFVTDSPVYDDSGKLVGIIGVTQDITERKQTEKVLHQWADIFKYSQWGIVIGHAEDKTFEMFNPAFAKMYGYSVEELVGEPIAKVFAPEVRASAPQYIEMVNKLGYYAFESKHVRKDGTVFPVWIEAQIVKDETGKTLHRVANVRDITERKQAEQALQRSEAKLRNVLETVKLMAVSLDIKGNITFCNDFLLKVTGWKRKDIIGKNWFTTFIPPKIRKDLKESVFLKAFNSGEFPAHYENEIITRKGKRRLIAWNNTGFHDQNGQVISVTSVGEDITERREAESALQESEEKFRSIVETTREWIWEMSRDGMHTYSNPSVKTILGYEPNEIIGKSCFSFIHKEDCELVKKRLAEIVKKKQGWQGWVFRWRHKDGTLRYLESNAVPILERGKKLVGFRGADRDITERKQSEQALAKSEEKYRSLFEESKDTIFITTPDGKFLDVNPAGVELFGYDSKEELMKASIIQDLFYDPEDRSKLERLIETEGFVKDYELTLKRKDGQKLTVLEAAIASRNEKGKIVAYRGILHDLTERKRLQEQLLHAQKMETIGTLAGGIAHDFNNLLTVIAGNAEFGLQDFAPYQTGYPEFLAIAEAAQQARDLTHQLLIFSRRQVTHFRQVDFNRLLKDVLQMLHRIIPENIEIRKKLIPGLGPIFADKAQIQQVIMNLCLNARDAMPQGGVIEVKTQLTVFTAKSLLDSENDSGAAQDGVLLIIADTGVGMDDETLDHIFEPFFTTKRPGHGTGLGLAVVYGIVQEHGGLINVTSTIGQGTRFGVYLPFGEKAETVKTGLSENQELRGGNETILLVEDHHIVRSVGKRILEDLGYKVLIAKDGEEAVQALESQAHWFDLVVMDVVLPKLSGPQVFEMMHQVRPQLPVVFVTGYDLGAELRGLKHTDKKVFLTLQKPYTKQTLGKAVRELLDRFHD